MTKVITGISPTTDMFCSCILDSIKQSSQTINKSVWVPNLIAQSKQSKITPFKIRLP